MASKTTVTISIDPRLAKQARDLKLDLEKAAETGLKQAVRAERERLWRQENANAVEASNAFVARNGLLSGRLRDF